MLLPEYVYAGVRTVIVSDVVNKLSVNIFIFRQIQQYVNYTQRK